LADSKAGGKRWETGEREKRKDGKTVLLPRRTRRKAKKGEKLLRIKIKKGRREAGDGRQEKAKEYRFTSQGL